uniref:Uncharacterized protein n=1 Tax=Anguilla anguilla TaxID=7936 RepID=A0A0E9RXD1_ANGAN
MMSQQIRSATLFFQLFSCQNKSFGNTDLIIVPNIPKYL